MSHLRSDRHPQADFFVADILDAAPKDDIASMEHPLFALRAGDYRVREYRHRGTRVTVKPGWDGCATIHDKDLWIYCISQLVEALNRGRADPGQTVRFTAYDFLVSTNRGTSGRSYERMSRALERLSGTRIETNVETQNKRERAGFGLVESWRVIERDDRDRMVAVEVTLPRWLYRAAQARQVLSISRDYFRLRKPIDRRLYELVRKHCGAQRRWRVSLQVLHRKAGSSAAMREFRRSVRALAESDQMPGYRLRFDGGKDTLTAYARGNAGAIAQINDTLAAGSGEGFGALFRG
jgi:plasmid replication initiation protein